MDNQEYNDIEIKAIWKKLSSERFANDKLKKQEIMEAIKSKSSSTIAQLKKAIKVKMTASLFLPFILLLNVLVYEKDMWILCGWGFLTVLYIGLGYILYKKYRGMNEFIPAGSNISEVISNNLAVMKSALKYEAWFGYTGIIFFYCFFVALIASDSDVNTKELAIVSIISLVVMILVTLGFERAGKGQYGVKIKELEEDLIRMETLDL